MCRYAYGCVLQFALCGKVVVIVYVHAYFCNMKPGNRKQNETIIVTLLDICIATSSALIRSSTVNANSC